MFNRNNTRTYLVLASVAALLIGLYSAGCKEEPTETVAPAKPQSETTPAVQQGAAKPLEQAIPKPAEGKVVEEVKSVAESEAQTAKIIAGARSWGAVNKPWYGKAAPDFEMTALDGTTHKLSEYKGKKILLVFWATWCPPCRAEIPDLNKLRAKTDAKDIAIVAVAGVAPGAPPDTLAKVTKFSETTEMSYDVFLEKGEIPDPFGVGRIYTTTGIPGSFMIDAEGIIRLQAAGIVPLEDIEGLLDAI